jgi:hypothetical protein
MTAPRGVGFGVAQLMASRTSSFTVCM